MIVTAFVYVLFHLFAFFISTTDVGVSAPGPSFSHVTDGFSTVAPYVIGLGNWVPWSQMLMALGFSVVFLGVAFGIRVVRICVSALSGGGGA